MPMYNLIEYSDNYQDSSATLYQYKRDEPPEDDTVADLTADNSSSFKYKIKLLGNVTEVVGNAAGVRRLNVKIVVPLKYLSNFFRSLEMPLINCKIKLNLTWKKECVTSGIVTSVAKIVAVTPNSSKTVLASAKSTFFINPKPTFINGARSLPRNPRD